MEQMEHITIINRIVDAEKDAREMSAKAQSKLAALPDELKAEREKIRASFFERAQRRLNIVAEEEEKHAQEVIAELDRQLADDLATVDSLLEQNFEVWVDKLFSHVVGA